MSYLGLFREKLRASRYRFPVICTVGAGLGFFGIQANSIIKNYKKENDSIFDKSQNVHLRRQATHYLDLNTTELILKGLGFGDDWMSELPMEKRAMIKNWPWGDWFFYNFFPFHWFNWTLNDDLDAATAHDFYVAEICPDCYRFMLWTTLALFTTKIVIHRMSLTSALLSSVITFSCINGLATGQSGAFMLTNHNSLIAAGNHRDLAYTAYDIHIKRVRYSAETSLVKKNLTCEQAMINYITRLEMALQQRIYPMNEIENYVASLDHETKKKIGIQNWEVGRPYPEEEMIDMIMYEGVKPTSSINSSPIVVENSEKLDEMEIFMLKLQGQLSEESKR